MRSRIYGRRMKWSDYVARLMNGRNQADIALLAGVSQGTISRWLNNKGNGPDIQGAVDFARACGGNPVEALVVLGVIRPRELDKVIEVGASADDLTNGRLVELLARRLGVRVTLTEGRRGA